MKECSCAVSKPAFCLAGRGAGAQKGPKRGPKGAQSGFLFWKRPWSGAEADGQESEGAGGVTDTASTGPPTGPH